MFNQQMYKSCLMFIENARHDKIPVLMFVYDVEELAALTPALYEIVGFDLGDPIMLITPTMSVPDAVNLMANHEQGVMAAVYNPSYAYGWKTEHPVCLCCSFALDVEHAAQLRNRTTGFTFVAERPELRLGRLASPRKSG